MKNCGTPGTSPSTLLHLLVASRPTVCSGSAAVERPPRRGQNSRDSGHLQAKAEDAPPQAAPLPTPPYLAIIANCLVVFTFHFSQ